MSKSGDFNSKQSENVVAKLIRYFFCFTKPNLYLVNVTIIILKLTLHVHTETENISWFY